MVILLSFVFLIIFSLVLLVVGIIVFGVEVSLSVFFVFGDLFVDNGNNNYLVIMVCVDVFFYGIDYFLSYSLIGCFFNGYNIFDFIS